MGPLCRRLSLCSLIRASPGKYGLVTLKAAFPSLHLPLAFAGLCFTGSGPWDDMPVSPQLPKALACSPAAQSDGVTVTSLLLSRGGHFLTRVLLAEMETLVLKNRQSSLDVSSSGVS